MGRESTESESEPNRPAGRGAPRPRGGNGRPQTEAFAAGERRDVDDDDRPQAEAFAAGERGDDRQGGRKSDRDDKAAAQDKGRKSSRHDGSSEPADHDDSDESADGEKQAEKDKADSPEAKRKKRRILIIAVIVLVVVAVVGVLWWLHARQFATTDDAFVEGHVVAISPQVSARVLKVHVDDNQIVAAGAPLVDLDPTDYEVALAQAKGAEAGARGKREQAASQLPAAEAGVREADASVQVAQVNFENADADLKRYQALEERARSKQQYDNAVAAQRTAAAQVEAAKAKLATSQSQVGTAKATVTAADGDVAKAAADLRRAQVNLAYCHVVAPVGGRVTRKSVEPGAYVTPAQALLAVVPPDVWVVANYKETQLDNMRVGQPVSISVDAFGGHDVTGKVQSIQAGTGSRFAVLPAENATGNFVKVVQRVPVKIVLDQPDPGDGRFLSPGMSVVVKTRVRD